MQLANDERCVRGAIGAGLQALLVSRAGLILLCAIAAVTLAVVQPRALGTAAPSVAADAQFAIDANGGPSAGSGDGAVWLRGSYRLSEPPAETIAFHMSGLFAAELWWNGRRLGRKGIPGENAEEEVAGPIDAAILLPPSLLRRDNRWAIRLSSHHVGYSPASAVQELRIGPYRSEGRDLVHYLPALLVFGAVLACAAWGLGGWLARRDRRAGTLGLGGLCLGGALAAEVSRGVINYPYDWHLVRQALTLLFLAAHAILLLIGSARPAKARPTWDRALCWATALAMLLGAATLTGFDQKMLALLGLSYLGLAGRVALRSPWQGGEAAIGVLSLTALAMLLYRMDVHLDAGAYAFGLALLTAALAAAAPSVRPGGTRAGAGAGGGQRILLGFPGGERIVRWADVQALRASGNYSCALMRDGTQILDRRALSRLLELAPPNLVRVHRSHAADLETARSLERVRRGSHQLVLAGGVRVPVSRERYAEVRERLGAPGRQKD